MGCVSSLATVAELVDAYRLGCHCVASVRYLNPSLANVESS